MSPLLNVLSLNSPSFWAPKSKESGRGGRKKINDTFHVCVCVRTFQLWNLIKLTSKEEELEALPGHSWHVGWLAHRFIKMGQSANTSRFSRRGLVYFRPRQLFCSTLACTALISGEWTSILVRAAYNEHCFVHSDVAVMNMKQCCFPSCKSRTVTSKKWNLTRVSARVNDVRQNVCCSPLQSDPHGGHNTVLKNVWDECSFLFSVLAECIMSWCTTNFRAMTWGPSKRGCSI